MIRADNPYKENIIDICTLYLGGNITEAEILTIETLCFPDELAGLDIPGCMAYIKEGCGKEKDVRPMIELYDAFEAENDFKKDTSDKKQHKGLRLLRKFSAVKKYFNEEQLQKFNPRFEEIKSWMEANSKPVSDEKAKPEKHGQLEIEAFKPKLPKKKAKKENPYMSELEKSYHQKVRLFDKSKRQNNLSEKQVKFLKGQIRDLSYKVFLELEEKTASREIPYDEKVRAYNVMISTVKYLDLTRVQKFDKKKRLYVDLARLHGDNGNEKGKLEALEGKKKYENAQFVYERRFNRQQLQMQNYYYG